MLNITCAENCDLHVLERFWLRITLNDYWFLSAEQWWKIAMQRPWQQKNMTTWVAQNTSKKEILGLISLCENKIHAFHLEPKVSDFFIAKQLLWHAIGTRNNVYMDLFTKETKHREILHDYGFQATEIDDKPANFQKIIKMCLHVS